MPNWLLMSELLDYLDIKQSEFVEYLSKGLQPYSNYDFMPIPCPDFCHEYHVKFDQQISIESSIRALNELLKFEKYMKEGNHSVRVQIHHPGAYDTIASICDVFKNHNGIHDFDLSVEDIENLKIVKNKQKEKLGKIQEQTRKIVNEDPECTSWKFFFKPVNAAESKGLVKYLNEHNTVFKSSEVVEKLNRSPQFNTKENRKLNKPSKDDKNILACDPDTEWKDIKITLIDEGAVRIKTPKGEGRFTYSELGMSDKRSGNKPTMLWGLLKIFAKNHGIVESQNVKFDRKLPDTANRLNKHMQSLFVINDTIFEGHYKKIKGYKTKIIFSDQTTASKE